MSDPTGPKPPVIGGDDTPLGRCGIGLRNVTIRFSDCASGSGLINWNLHLGWTNSAGSLVATGNGSDWITMYCLMPGIRYRVTCLGYDDVDFEITAQDVSSRTRSVCLNAKPAPPRRQGRCCFTTAAVAMAFGEIDESSEAALDALRDFRDAIDGQGAGARVVEAYYDDTVSAVLTKVVESDARLALMVVTLLLELQPFLSGLSSRKRWAQLRLAERFPPHLQGDTPPRLTPQTAKRIARLADILREQGGADVEKPLRLLKEQVERCTNLNVFDLVERLREG